MVVLPANGLSYTLLAAGIWGVRCVISLSEIGYYVSALRLDWSLHCILKKQCIFGGWETTLNSNHIDILHPSLGDRAAKAAFDIVHVRLEYRLARKAVAHAI